MANGWRAYCSTPDSFRELPKPERKVLTVAVFGELEVNGWHIVDHVLNHPLDALLGAQRNWQGEGTPEQPRATDLGQGWVGW